GETRGVRISGQALEWTVSSRYDTQLISGNSELFHKVRPILIWTASPPGLQVRKPEQDIKMGPEAEQTLVESAPEGKYVYCIIETKEPRSFGPMGIGGRGDEVYTIRHRGLAAVVSNTPLVVYDPTRENVFTHEQVNETVMREFTVLPMAFGALFRTDEDIIELIRGTYDALRDVLAKMEGKVEFGLKVNWDRDKVTSELEEKDDEISHLKEQITSRTTGSTYFARMQLGRLIETALTDQADAYIREVYSLLRDTAVASRANKPIGDRMIMNAAFLIERDHEA